MFFRRLRLSLSNNRAKQKKAYLLGVCADITTDKAAARRQDENNVGMLTILVP
jgi:hypothetical protein